jgi:dihydroorotase
MSSTLIVNANIVNEGKAFTGDVLIRSGRIERIGTGFQVQGKFQVIDAKGKLLLPGVIDDQVHFREPGLTHKGDIGTESRAAVAGGVTSFMEMPNTVPPVFTQALLEEKFQRAAVTSAANYSFFMGTSNDNYEEVMRTNLNQVCGLKIFMGSSTGNLLVDDPDTLGKIFGSFEGLIAVHCEHEPTVRQNNLQFKETYGDRATTALHPVIRNVDACYLSSSFAVGLAEKHGTRLHILHISTGKETNLFRNDIPLSEKKITAEACIHHLWFCDEDYSRLGNLIKWNPAIKSASDRKQIWDALLDDRIDVIATDHAPHTLEEKSKPYFEAPSGGPLIQHSLPAMLEFWNDGKISLERIVQKMSHNPAILFGIEERGFIREGYWADLVLVDPNAPWVVSKENILAKCGWSPLMGQKFRSSVTETFVSGNLVYQKGGLHVTQPGLRLTFKRK